MLLGFLKDASKSILFQDKDTARGVNKALRLGMYDSR
jgi:hypothetical protein